MADRTSKRGDNWEPVTGRAMDANGPVDLRGATLRFLGLNENDELIDSGLADPDHGTCVNVEDVDGPGDDETFYWPEGQFVTQITVPENRGRYRFEPTEGGVSTVGLYGCECEATMSNGKKITFPNRKSANPQWQIDPDVA